MTTQYTNLTLYGVSQDCLIDYLSAIGRDSYVSPTENHFTTVYDSSFGIDISSLEGNSKAEQLYRGYENLFITYGMPEEYLDENLRKLRLAISKSQASIKKIFNLDSLSSKILKRYGGTIEGVLVCWASHLSAKFSCPVLAIYLRDDSQFWYHLSQNGSTIDEYTTYAESGWQPGQPILTNTGTEIKGGNAKKLCTAFGKQEKANQVETILRKPHGWDENNSFAPLSDYATLLNLRSFPNSIWRHYALTKALEIPPWWVLYMSYSSISMEVAKDYFDDYDRGPSGEEALVLLKQARPR